MASQSPSLRPIAPVQLPADTRPARDLGPRGRLVELPVSSLVVDDAYQRQVRAGGRANVLRMVEAFDWRRFGVLVVTPVGEGKYAVIDGQHRATAALMHPSIDLVPAMVVEADTATAAQVCASLNGQVTRITNGDVFIARVAGGEEFAVSVMDVCKAAGVTVLCNKATNAGWKPGETLAIGAIEGAVKNHGHGITRRCLEALAQPKHAGELRAVAIQALTDIVAADPRWLDRDLVAVLGRIRLGDMILSAGSKAKERRTVVRAVLVGMLANAMADAWQRMDAKAAPAAPAVAAGSPQASRHGHQELTEA